MAPRALLKQSRELCARCEAEALVNPGRTASLRISEIEEELYMAESGVKSYSGSQEWVGIEI